MTEIKINTYDEKKSKSDDQSWMIYFLLSLPPDQAWIASFNSIRSKNKNPNNQVLINSVSIKGKELIVQAPARVTAQQILDEMKRVVELTNQAQGGFKKQLEELKFD